MAVSNLRWNKKDFGRCGRRTYSPNDFKCFIVQLIKLTIVNYAEMLTLHWSDWTLFGKTFLPKLKSKKVSQSDQHYDRNFHSNYEDL